MMNVFFDTEFTTLDVRGDLQLISIGLVSESGKEFYRELSDTYHSGLCSDFTREVVLPLLDGGACKTMEAQLSVQLRDWVESLGDEEVVFRSDSPNHDWPFVNELMTFYGTWPKNMRKKCGGIFFEEDRERHRFQMGLSDYWKMHGAKRHHALIDARSLQFAYKFAMRGKA